LARLPVAFVFIAVLGIVTGSSSDSASAAPETTNAPNSYLALGDSLPFGLNPLLVQPGVDPDRFVGYPELVAKFQPQTMLFNASCPGETSSSLISGSRPDFGCQDYRQFVGSLHFVYTGSQLAYAKSLLTANPRTGLVTMTVGANDVLMLLASCAGRPDPSCVNAALPGVLTTLADNLTTIYTTLRQTGFQGKLVAVTYYSLNYADPSSTALVTTVDGTLTQVTKAFGGTIADGFGVFKAASAPFGGDPCAAGLLIHLTASSCDDHPSLFGAALLAGAVLYANQQPS
jgi:hypothetical protein